MGRHDGNGGNTPAILSANTDTKIIQLRCDDRFGCLGEQLMMGCRLPLIADKIDLASKGPSCLTPLTKATKLPHPSGRDF